MYDPESCWSAALLARISSRLTQTLMWILLFGVLALYLAASSIEMFNRPSVAHVPPLAAVIAKAGRSIHKYRRRKRKHGFIAD
jgi:hypothetical protein